MPTFQLRMNKPENEQLWEQFRAACDAQGHSAQWVLVYLIRQFLAGKVKVKP